MINFGTGKVQWAKIEAYMCNQHQLSELKDKFNNKQNLTKDESETVTAQRDQKLQRIVDRQLPPKREP